MQTPATMRPIDWVHATVDEPGHIAILDQTLLPGQTRILHIRTVDELVEAIGRLAVRGAPALGVAGGLGVVLAALTTNADQLDAELDRIRHARPTAVNLTWGVEQVRRHLHESPQSLLAAALHVRDEDIAASERMAAAGASLLAQLLPSERAQSATLMTICNTGALAAVEHGTALGVIERMHLDGRLHRAIACETRPLLQGARLTAWELQRMGAPFDLIVDSAAAGIIARGGVDAVLVGADRIAANADTANKVGTFSLALAAQYAAIPFLVVAPESTIDAATASGLQIEIEDRGSAEVCEFGARPTAPPGTTAINPAFDVTPAELICAIVTDRRIIRPSLGDRPDDPLESAH